MSSIHVGQTKDGRVYAATPYHPDFVKRAKQLNGRFGDLTLKGKLVKAWFFDARDEARVREVCVLVYGTDGTPTETTTLRVNVSACCERVGVNESLMVAGRQVAFRPSRDVEVKLGEGVLLVSGSFPLSGGSTKYPELKPSEGTVAIVRDVPVAAALNAVAEWEGLVEVIREGTESVPSALTPAETALLQALESLPPDSLARILTKLRPEVPAGPTG